MIASGNALPPPAYGVVCGINVECHAPINQRTRLIPIQYLQKLYELLKGLLKANVVSFSDSHPKMNGQDIRLCIDYKMVNTVTVVMEYAMPLGYDFAHGPGRLIVVQLTQRSEFWAIMITHRARTISAFVCPLGHFEWLRMLFGLQKATKIMRCGIRAAEGWMASLRRQDESCRGPREGSNGAQYRTRIFGAALYQLKDEDFEEDGNLPTAHRSFDMLKQKVVEASILRHFDRTKEVHIMLFVNKWALRTTLLQVHMDKLHPVRF
ncbi:hypothetical protein PHMEG_0002581 [Phytophthora megakarya]|uniref:Reverse transcriptase n=1 Tax=Phytophthora megakarya TaxID=4795 RepID=A0A225X044_9STRA|nr:hypothetical protein PHMEG_0002581 [Phytophthora megakarya]